MAIKGFVPTPSAPKSAAPKSGGSQVMIDFKRLDQFIRGYANDFAVRMYPNGKLNVNQWSVGNIYGDDSRAQGSFRVTVSGQYAGLGKEFSPAGDFYGENLNLIQIWAIRYGVPIHQAAQEIVQFMGLRPADFAWNNPLEGSQLSGKVKFAAPDPSASIAAAPPAVPVIGGFKLITKMPEQKAAHHLALKTMRDAMRGNEKAMEYLASRQITAETLKYFSLGLNGTVDFRGVPRKTPNAMIFPLMNTNGVLENRYGFYNIPGLTENPMDPNGWITGNPTAYCSSPKGNQHYMVVVEGMKDLWRTWQFLCEHGIQDHFWLVTSTHGTNPPWEAFESWFWKGHKEILLAYDNDKAGEAMVQKMPHFIWTVAQERCRRLPVPARFGKDMTDVLNKGNPTLAQFRSLIKGSKLLSTEPPVSEEHASELGRLEENHEDSAKELLLASIKNTIESNCILEP